MSNALMTVHNIMVGHGISPQQADLICADISAAIGGERVYIAVRLRSDSGLARRNAEIYASFRGNNLREVADRFGLCTQQIRRILKQQRQGGVYGYI